MYDNKSMTDDVCFDIGKTTGHLGGYSWEFLVGVCRPVLQILTRFQTKKCNF